VGLADNARKRFAQDERERIEAWRGRAKVGAVISRVARAAVGHHDAPTLHAPVDRDLGVTLEWHQRGAVVTFDEDDLELFARVDEGEDGDEVSVQLFVVMPCRRCGGKTPHGPEVRHGGATLGGVLVAGVPVEGHPCAPSAT
jgi:hypothetical protein